MTAVVSGQADIGLAGPEACIYVATAGQGGSIRVIFAQLTKRDGSFLVGRTRRAPSRWENLRGKTIIGGRAGRRAGDDAGVRPAPARPVPPVRT